MIHFNNMDISKLPRRRRSKAKGKGSPSKVKKPKQRCCGDTGCLRSCLGKVTKSVKSDLKKLVKEATEVGSDACGSFLRQYMIGREVTEFGIDSKHRRQVWWRYFIPVPAPITCVVTNEPAELVEVCFVAFREIFGVTERYIRTARQDETSHLRRESIKCKGKIRRLLKHDVIPVSIMKHQEKCSDSTQLKNIYGWSTFQVNDETVEKLFDEGFTSLLAISCIREDDLKYLKRTTGINLGQIVLLREAINALHSEAWEDSENNNEDQVQLMGPPVQISPMEVVIPVRMDVSPEQALMLQGSPSPPVEQVPADEPPVQEGEGSGEDGEGNEASGGEGSGGEGSESEKSGDEGSGDEESSSSSSDEESDDN